MIKALKRAPARERLIFFSDAVFAIAIILLIIDIRIPYHESFTDNQLLRITGGKVPQLFGFFISFFLWGILDRPS